MFADSVKTIFPFMPAKEFETATQFYKDIGFICPKDEEGVRVFKLGDVGFLLQDYYVEDWANNFMMNMHVDDAEKWYQHIKDTGVTDRYEGTRVSPPKLVRRRRVRGASRRRPHALPRRHGGRRRADHLAQEARPAQ